MPSSRRRLTSDRSASRADSAPLQIHSCRDLCSWHRTPVDHSGGPLFACRGCGSQWIPSESWTPADRDGRIPDEVRAIRKGD